MSRTQRLLSLDCLRGFTILFLVGLQPILLSLSKSYNWTFLREQLTHATWRGMNAWDLVMPLFLFVTGVSMPFALSKYTTERGSPTWHYMWRIVRRVAVLWVLGMVVQGNLLSLNPDKFFYFTNTLQAIAVGYLIASIILLIPYRSVQIVCTLSLLAIYSLLLFYGEIEFHGVTYGLGQFGLANNFATGIDRFCFPGGNGDPTYAWIVPSLSFGALVMLGAHTGQLLSWNALRHERELYLLLAVGLLMVAGGVLGLWIPLVKPLFTPSFTLVAGGICMLITLGFYIIIDMWGVHFGMSWLQLFGRNALLAYVIGEYAHRPLCIFAEHFVFGFKQYVPSDIYPVIIQGAALLMLTGLLWLLQRAGLYLRA